MKQTTLSTIAASLGWLALGTVGALGLAEAGLRIAGPLFSRAHAPEHDLVVLCEGDSFTYGMGGLSYPDQIEAVVEERFGRKVSAINEGIPGLTTAMVADRLEEHILETRPDYIVVVIGENNSWNSATATSPTTRAVERALLHSRVYKLFKIVSIGWRHNTFHEAAGTGGDVQVPESPENIGLLLDGEQSPEVRAMPSPREGELERFLEIARLQEAGRYDEALLQVEAWIGRNPESPAGFVSKGATLMRLGRDAEAHTAALTGLALPVDPFHEDLYFQGGQALRRQGDAEAARALWARGLMAFPASRALYWSLARSFYDAQRAFEVIDVVANIPGIDVNPMHQGMLRVRDATAGVPLNDAVTVAFEQDVERMVDIAQSYGVPLLFSSYPDAIYPEVERAARRRGADFIDLRSSFQQRFPRREDYISADRCHCNTAGYRLMAELFVDRMASAVPHLAGGAP